MTQLVGGQGAELVTEDTFWYGDFFKSGALLPLDDLIKADGYDLAPFWPALLQDIKVQNQLVGLPNNGNIGANIYYYNADLLKAAGAAEPDPKVWTTDDLLEIAKKVTKKGQVWGFQPFTKSTFFFGHFTRMFGSELISDDGKKSLLDSKEAVAAMKWLYDLVYTHEVTPSLTEPLGPMTDNFVAGKIAIYHQFVGQASTLTRLKPPFAWKALVAPIGPGKSRGEHPQGAILGVTPTSSSPADAFKVLKFYCSKDDGIQHVLSGVGSPGTRTDVWQSPELTGFHPIFKMVADLIPSPKPARWAANGRDAELGDTWNNYQDKIWLKSVSFEEGVQQLQKESQAVLDKPED
jgi:ABC-type glycerol-3-phosphate transport system substrate-binding protein